MSTKFYVPAKAKPDFFRDNVSLNDAVKYEIDFSPWQEDNSDITSVTWTVEYGEAAISGQTEMSGLASALLTFAQRGRNLISIKAASASEVKQVWLEVYAKELQLPQDDYGLLEG